MSKKSKFKKSGDFYTDLGMKESSGEHGEENRKTHYIGFYQIGEAALVDAGYYNSKPLKPGQKEGQQYNNDWSGTWTEKAKKCGINNKDDFLNNKPIQDIAVREYHQKVWGYLKNFHQYEGQEKGGIKLCKANMISAAHLVGHGGIKSFIKSDGKIDVKDANGVPCSKYLKTFKGYTIDYSADKLIADYKQPHHDLANVIPDKPSPIKTDAQGSANTYIVQQGDTLSAIAQKNSISLAQLLEISGNEQYKANPNVIQQNQEVKLQAPQAQQLAQKATTEKQAQEAAQKVAAEKQAQEAAQQAATEKQAQEAALKLQQETATQALQAAQKAAAEKQAQEAALKLQQETAAQSLQVAQKAAAEKANTYIVQQGDTLLAIAQKNNASLAQLLEISGNEQYKANPNAIQPNQEVKLQAPQALQLAQKAATEKQAQEAALKLQQETAAQALQVAQKRQLKKLIHTLYNKVTHY